MTMAPSLDTSNSYQHCQKRPNTFLQVNLLPQMVFKIKSTAKHRSDNTSSSVNETVLHTESLSIIP
jgi:hypothetical protein